MKKICLVFIIGLVVTGCVASGVVFITPIPEPESDAATLYRNRCSGCHSLPHPTRHTYAQWINMVSVMDKRMEERGLPLLEEKERRVLLDYLKKHARGGGG